MSLLQLPPEILIEIFDYIGSSFFRSDISRLTVCKQWSRFAYPACFQHLYLTQKILQRLMSYSQREISLHLIKRNAEVVEMSFKGFEDGVNSLPLIGRGDQVHVIQAVWTKALDWNLFVLACVVKESRKMHTLQIRTTSELDPLLLSPNRRNYLYLSTIRTFLYADKLTRLDLDLCGTRLLAHRNQKHDEGFHICPTIAALLTKLRYLRLRLREICSHVLKVTQQSTNLPLSEVIINLSLSSELPSITSVMHAKNCDPTQGTFIDLRMNLEEQARALLARMSAPKMVRILEHTYPVLQLQAFDVLNDRRLLLKEGASWDEEGNIIEDSESEESQISDWSWEDDI